MPIIKKGAQTEIGKKIEELAKKIPGGIFNPESAYSDPTGGLGLPSMPMMGMAVTRPPRQLFKVFHGASRPIKKWADRITGGQSEVDIRGIHLTQDPEVAKLFGKNIRELNLPARNPLKLTPEEVYQKKAIHLYKRANGKSYKVNSLDDALNMWREDSVAKGMEPELIKELEENIRKGTLRMANIKGVPISNLDLEPLGHDAVIWPTKEEMLKQIAERQANIKALTPNLKPYEITESVLKGGGIPKLTHLGEDEVTVIRPRLLEAIDRLARMKKK